MKKILSFATIFILILCLTACSTALPGYKGITTEEAVLADRDTKKLSESGINVRRGWSSYKVTVSDRTFEDLYVIGTADDITYFTFLSDGKWGVVNEYEEEIIAPTYNYPPIGIHENADAYCNVSKDSFFIGLTGKKSAKIVDLDGKTVAKFDSKITFGENESNDRYVILHGPDDKYVIIYDYIEKEEVAKITAEDVNPEMEDAKVNIVGFGTQKFGDYIIVDNGYGEIRSGGNPVTYYNINTGEFGNYAKCIGSIAQISDGGWTFVYANTSEKEEGKEWRKTDPALYNVSEHRLLDYTKLVSEKIETVPLDVDRSGSHVCEFDGYVALQYTSDDEVYYRVIDVDNEVAVGDEDYVSIWPSFVSNSMCYQNAEGMSGWFAKIDGKFVDTGALFADVTASDDNGMLFVEYEGKFYYANDIIYDLRKDEKSDEIVLSSNAISAETVFLYSATDKIYGTIDEDGLYHIVRVKKGFF